MEALIEGKFIPIGPSIAKARAVLERISMLFAQRFEAADGNGKRVFKWPDDNASPVKDWELQFLKAGLTEFETVFAEEMRGVATYFVRRHGIYDTPALIDAADGIFPEDLLAHIPDKAKRDWKAAGRCLALDLPSASGFHVARAVEGCIEAYYQCFSGKFAVTFMGWKAYTDALHKIADEGPHRRPSRKTLAVIDQMRDDHRNPIFNMRTELTESDARMMFANGESVIIAIAQELRDADKNGVQSSLHIVGGSQASGQSLEA